jgi:hypothetical protein
MDAMDGMMSFCADYRIIQEAGVKSLQNGRGSGGHGVPPEASSITAVFIENRAQEAPVRTL